jgi:hypothetical protein
MEFVELPADGRSKYPALLKEIRDATNPDNLGKWVKLSAFDSASSARDTASRLRGEHPDFAFSSRSDDEGPGGAVYASYTEGLHRE